MFVEGIIDAGPGLGIAFALKSLELGGENIGCLRGRGFGGPRSPAVQHEDDIFAATAAAPHEPRGWISGGVS